MAEVKGSQTCTYGVEWSPTEDLAATCPDLIRLLWPLNMVVIFVVMENRRPWWSYKTRWVNRGSGTKEPRRCSKNRENTFLPFGVAVVWSGEGCSGPAPVLRVKRPQIIRVEPRVWSRMITHLRCLSGPESEGFPRTEPGLLEEPSSAHGPERPHGTQSDLWAQKRRPRQWVSVNRSRKRGGDFRRLLIGCWFLCAPSTAVHGGTSLPTLLGSRGLSPNTGTLRESWIHL